MLVDSHCHLNFPDLASRMDDVRANMAANAVSHALLIGVNRPDYPAVRALAEQYDNFTPPSAYTPMCRTARTSAKTNWWPKPSTRKWSALAKPGWTTTGARAIWNGSAALSPPYPRRPAQRPAAGDPHPRIGARHPGGDARSRRRAGRRGDALLYRKLGSGRGALELGFYISFSGIVTFKNATALKEVARRVPLERLLVETDSPYLAPMPHRGKTNEPAYVRHVAAHVAELRGMALEDLAAASTDNFYPVRQGVAWTLS